LAFISSEDKWGNKPFASHIAEFHACLNYCNLINLGFSGPKYTWTNSQDVSSLIMQRLSRDFANPDWRSLFPEAIVTHLTHTHSDYCLILLAFHHNPFCFIARTFRFESIWPTHPDFSSVVEQAWALPSSNLSHTFHHFSSLVVAWNKLNFGNIFQKKCVFLLEFRVTNLL
jgi:hypothetical protein